MHLKGKLYKFAEVFFYNYTFFLSFYAILIIMALIPYYENGAVILGGEGHYVLDFSEHLQKFGRSATEFHHNIRAFNQAVPMMPHGMTERTDEIRGFPDQRGVSLGSLAR